MSFYLVAAIDIHDPETYGIYIEKATAAFQPFVAKQTIMSPLQEAPVVFEGKAPGHLLVTQFRSMEDIYEFYNSPGYQEAIPYRNAAATTHYYIAVRGA
ncbi:DUF1330 domain-containing protein [Pectobacterium betavasculorum]|uniref:DUF1330 domain-containing protein n=1 Tax=Pectobacterium betavasculorum TaxID=55207 RepID=UPI00313CB356